MPRRQSGKETRGSSRWRALLHLSVVLVFAVGVLRVIDGFGSPVSTPASSAATPDVPDVPDVNGDGHRRVLLVGDSLMVDAFAAIEKGFNDPGVEVEYEGWAGTGLLTDQTWWIDLINDAVAASQPDVVVVESCCNYEGDYLTPAGSIVVPDSEEMYRYWEDNAVAAIDSAGSLGADVYMVITPTAAEGAELDFPAERIERFNDIYRRLGVPTIDWNAAVTGPGFHNPDGLHFNQTGSQRFADVTIDAIVRP